MIKNDNENCHGTPPTNRGVVIPCKSDVFLLFDWVQATFFLQEKNLSIYEVFFYLFGVDDKDILLNEKSSHFGYNYCYSYRDICIFTSDREDMGYHLYMTGSACRDFEDMGLKYMDLFYKLSKLNVHYTRVDVSIDDFSGKYFKFNEIKKCVLNRSVISKFRTSTEFTKTNLKDVDNIGYTIWFGTRASNIQFVFYDKLKERIYNANCDLIDENIKSWVRFEMRYRNDYADTIIINYMLVNDFNNWLFSLINNYISFRIPNKNETHRNRWKYCSWWSSFLGNVGKIRFQPKPVEYSVVKKKNWLYRSCSYSAFQVLLSDIKDISCDEVLSQFLFDFLQKGSEDISDVHLQKINQYRLKNNLKPLDRVEIKDFVQNIKDVIIAKNEK